MINHAQEHPEFQEHLDLQDSQVHMGREVKLEYQETWDHLVSPVNRADLVYPVSRVREGNLAFQD